MVRRRSFFLIDRRVIPDAMPWRHTDTNVRDDFPTNYNEGDEERLAEFNIPLRPPPRHLLYVCGLTTACRHPELSYSINDQDGKGNKHNRCTMDDFLKLSVWNGTFVSKGDLILDDQRLPLRITPPLEVGKLILEKNPTQRSVEKSNFKIVAAREKKDQQNLVKAQTKRAGERGGGSIAPQKAPTTPLKRSKERGNMNR
ncbi:hypothetical protein Tco_1047448 [Tanacetum coccineum]